MDVISGLTLKDATLQGGKNQLQQLPLISWKVMEAVGLSGWHVLETASQGIKGPRNLKIHTTDIMRLSYFTTVVIVTLVRPFYFSPAATETLVYTKENHQSTSEHSRPAFQHVAQAGSAGLTRFTGYKVNEALFCCYQIKLLWLYS